jgi:hypothetical protein
MELGNKILHTVGYNIKMHQVTSYCDATIILPIFCYGYDVEALN